MSERTEYKHYKFKAAARVRAWLWRKKGWKVTITPTISVKSGWPVHTGHLVKGVFDDV